MLRDFLRRVLLVAVDGEDKHVLSGVGFVQFRQTRHIGIVDRALRAEEKDNDGLFPLEIGDCPRLPRRVLEVELGDFLAEIR